MSNDEKKSLLKEGNARESNSLLIPTTLLGSVVDLLKDHLLNSKSIKVVQDEAEVLAVIAKIEGNLVQVKNHIQKKESDRNVPLPKSDKPPLFPPPPLIGGKHHYTYESVEELNGIAEESLSTSTSTTSSGIKGELRVINPKKRENKSQEDETHTRSFTQVGPLHKRRQSRRLSLPYMSQEDELVGAILFLYKN